MCRCFCNQARHADVALEFINAFIEPGNYYAYIDKNMIAQVVRNLLSNAIRFTQCGGAVFVSIVQEEDEGSFSCGHWAKKRKLLTVNVVDTGIGLSSVC